MADDVDELRLDIDNLRQLIDGLLDEGRSGGDPMIRACALTLQDRRHRLEQIEGQQHEVSRVQRSPAAG
jgi:hypothetical protein